MVTSSTSFKIYVHLVSSINSAMAGRENKRGSNREAQKVEYLESERKIESIYNFLSAFFC